MSGFLYIKTEQNVIPKEMIALKTKASARRDMNTPADTLTKCITCPWHLHLSSIPVFMYVRAIGEYALCIDTPPLRSSLNMKHWSLWFANFTRSVFRCSKFDVYPWNILQDVRGNHCTVATYIYYVDSLRVALNNHTKYRYLSINVFNI